MSGAAGRVGATLTLGNVLELALLVSAAVFVLLISVGLFRLAWRNHRGLPRQVRRGHLWRYLGSRAVVAVAVGLAFIGIVAAFLTLNTHRPLGDTTPSIRVESPAGRTTVRLDVEDCGSPAEGRLSVDVPRGAGQGATPAGRAVVYSDQDGNRPVKVNGNGVGTFSLDDPSTKRGLLSCYIGLPTVSGATGPVRVELEMADYMQVDTLESVPAPTGYRNGLWNWDCPAGEKCPALATVGFAFEDGAKQVIVLILASLIGAIIAVIIGEAVLSPLRRKLGPGETEPD